MRLSKLQFEIPSGKREEYLQLRLILQQYIVAGIENIPTMIVEQFLSLLDPGKNQSSFNLMVANGQADVDSAILFFEKYKKESNLKNSSWRNFFFTISPEAFTVRPIITNASGARKSSPDLRFPLKGKVLGLSDLLSFVFLRLRFEGVIPLKKAQGKEQELLRFTHYLIKMFFKIYGVKVKEYPYSTHKVAFLVGYIVNTFSPISDFNPQNPDHFSDRIRQLLLKNPFEIERKGTL